MKLSDYRRFCKKSKDCPTCALYIPEKKQCFFSGKPSEWTDEDIKEICERVKRRMNG